MRLGGKFIKSVSQRENILLEVKRHPAGLIPIYLASLVGIVLTIVVLRAVTDNPDLNVLNFSNAVWAIILFFIIGLIVTATFFARQIYWANELIVTDENIVQILRPSLFSQDVAQLNLGKVQDVSVSQRGFWQFWFKYGTIIIETAGEVASYKFAYAPNPNTIAGEIIKAHDRYIKEHGIDKQMLSGSP